LPNTTVFEKATGVVMVQLVPAGLHVAIVNVAFKANVCGSAILRLVPALAENPMKSTKRMKDFMKHPVSNSR
jgi:hypothetical protein